MIEMTEESSSQHSLVKSIFLHLFPGMAITIFVLSFTPFLLTIGLTPEFGLLFGFILIGEPFQIGYMLYLAKRKNRKISLQGIIMNREPQTKRNYFATPIFIVAVIFIISAITTPINIVLANTLFSWLPEWLLDSNPLLYTSSFLVIQMLFIFQLIVDGIINPIIEEFYWRGFLLPRLSRYGVYSVLISGFLIAIQHFWQIYNIIFMIPISLLLSFIVYRYRNVYLSIIAHCSINIISILVFYLGIFSNF